MEEESKDREPEKEKYSHWEEERDRQ